MAGGLGCAAALYGRTAQQATWGGPLWWPVAVVAVALTALSALGQAGRSERWLPRWTRQPDCR